MNLALAAAAEGVTAEGCGGKTFWDWLSTQNFVMVIIGAAVLLAGVSWIVRAARGL